VHRAATVEAAAIAAAFEAMVPKLMAPNLARIYYTT
jgi:hypothetical protein